MVTDRYAALRAALDAGPTPGPWSACGSAGYVQAGEGHPKHTILAVAYGHDGNHQINAPGSHENGKYIAAAHPETIRVLLADYDRLREALTAIEQWEVPLVESRGEVVSMSVAYGSNGVWDYFRGVARAALAQEQGGSDDA